MEHEQNADMALREKIQISNANLSRLDRQYAALSEMREAFLQEKVHAMLSGLPGDYADEVFEQLIGEESFPDSFRELTEREIVLNGDETAAHAPEAENPYLRNCFCFMTTLERISVCRRLAHAWDDRYRLHDSTEGDVWARIIGDMVQKDEHGDDELVPDLDARAPRPAGERVAYLKNTYTDLAYEQFADVLPNCTCAYYSDFPGVCEALYYGRATACILPLENTADGKLVRFYALLGKYDLRIAMTAEVTADDSDVTTKYALLRKSVTVPCPEEDADFENLYCECGVILEDGVTLSDILLAASMYGLTLSRADTDPLSYAEAESSYNLIFRIGEGDLQAMLAFLYLMTPQFTLLGIYPLI